MILTRALEMKRRLRNRLDEVEALFSISSLHVKRGELDEAQTFAREALTLARELSVPSLLIGGFELFAVIAGQRGNTPQAREIMSLAKALRTQHRYVYRIIDDLDAELDAIPDVQPLPHVGPEDVDRAAVELSAG